MLGVIVAGAGDLVGVSLGVFSAMHRNRLPDYAGVCFASLGSAVPAFVLGIFLIYVFAVQARWSATFGWDVKHGLIPAGCRRCSSSSCPSSPWPPCPPPTSRASPAPAVLDVLQQDYMRTARAKGLGSRTVAAPPQHAQRRHADPHRHRPDRGGIDHRLLHHRALFSVPGIGRLFVQSVNARDYGMIMGTTLFYAADHRRSRTWSSTSGTPSSTRGSATHDGTRPARPRRRRLQPRSRAPGFWSLAFRRLLKEPPRRGGAVRHRRLRRCSAPLAPLIAPHDPQYQDLRHTFSADVLGPHRTAPTTWGATGSAGCSTARACRWPIGIFAQLIVLGIGLPMGLIAGYSGKLRRLG